MDLEVIKKLMDELQSEMKYGKEDLAHRLGRKEEPEVKVVKIEGITPEKSIREAFTGPEKEGEEDGFLKGTPFASRNKDEDEEEYEESPEDKASDLKARLMKLRG